MLRYANKLQTLQINIPLNEFHPVTRDTRRPDKWHRAAGQSSASLIPPSSVTLIARGASNASNSWKETRRGTLEAEEHNWKWGTRDGWHERESTVRTKRSNGPSMNKRFVRESRLPVEQKLLHKRRRVAINVPERRCGSFPCRLNSCRDSRNARLPRRYSTVALEPGNRRGIRNKRTQTPNYSGKLLFAILVLISPLLGNSRGHFVRWISRGHCV